MKGKVFIVCLVSLAFSAIPANAQFKAAAKLGLADNRIVPGEEGDGSRTGFLIGAFGEYDFVDWFGLRAGLQFTQKGCGNKAATVTSGVKYFDNIQNISLNYLQLPVNLVFKTDVKAGSQTFSVGLGTGLYCAFLYGGKADIQFSETYEGKVLGHNVKNVAKIGLADGSQQALVLDRFNTFDIGADLSLEVVYKDFSLSAAYQKGFIDLSTDAPYVKSNACRTSSVLISLGYYFL